MSEQSVIHQMENWGYYLLPKQHPHSPGYSGLLVAIRETPTEMHFDPESMRLRLEDARGEVSRTTLSLRWSFRGTRRVFPGRIILRDRIGKRAEFFAFGGSVKATHIPGKTVYSLRSPAPVLRLTGPPETTPDQLASETEVVQGKLAAKWIPNEDEFARRLAQMNPLRLYLASLDSILARYKQTFSLREIFHDLYDALLAEKRWLMKTGQWPATPLSLEELLAPDRALCSLDLTASPGLVTRSKPNQLPRAISTKIGRKSRVKSPRSPGASGEYLL
jgi:hypothetical protein